MLWVSLFVLVVYCVSDSFLIRSTKKFFVIVYLFARVCAPRRMRPGVRVCVHVRERGVTFVQH